jgi:integral membrane protein
VQKLFPIYRVLAIVVGVLLASMAFVGMPLKYLLDEGTTWQDFGATITPVIAVAHGWIYMVYLVVAFLLARRSRWTWQFTAVMLVAGIIPILIFWVEHRVAQKMRAEDAPEDAPGLARHHGVSNEPPG